MNRIFKYPLNILATQVIELPASASILSVMKQRDKVVLYALIDDSEVETRKRSIEIFGTGHPISDRIHRDYLGTVAQENGDLVWHIFECFGEAPIVTREWQDPKAWFGVES